MQTFLGWVYVAGSAATFIALTIQDFPYFNALNWVVILPINAFLGAIWPIYWALLVPIMG